MFILGVASTRIIKKCHNVIVIYHFFYTYGKGKLLIFSFNTILIKYVFYVT